MVNNSLNDNYLDCELEKILMDEKDRQFVFKFEESILEFMENKSGMSV